MTKFFWTLTICAALGVTSSACGADDDDDDGAAGAAGMTAGTGGAAGSSPGGSGGSAGTTGMTMNVKCGTMMCASSAPAIPGIPPGLLPAPCCFNEAMSQCGRSMGGGACMLPPPPPMPHPNCPGARMGMMGCCINGMCGQDATLLGMGCVENAAAKAATMGLFPIPDPKTCDSPLPDPMMMGEDAGI
jgi:hypothetical protein